MEQRRQSSETSVAAGAAENHRHIVDVLIEERTQDARRHRLVWALMRRLLYPALHYNAALRMADAIADMPGRAVFDYIANLLALRVDSEGLDYVPRAGAGLIVANHPTGIADGIALYRALKDMRDDLVFVANRDALRVAPRLVEVLVPVEWVVEKRSFAKTRDMWRLVKNAFDAGRMVVMFPSGRVAQLRGGGLVDRDWHSATILFARRNRVPIVPLHISARNSWIYYLFARLNSELRDMTLFNELLNKRDKLFKLRFGPVISHEDLSGDPEGEILRLREFIERGLPAGQSWK